MLPVLGEGVKVHLGRLSDVLGEAVATHLYDRVCVLHLVPEGRAAPAERTVKAETQDERYHDTNRYSNILHRWVKAPVQDAEVLRARVGATVQDALSEQAFGEWAYDIVVLDSEELPPVGGAPAALALAGTEGLTKVAYLREDPERPLSAALLVSNVEVVPVGLLGDERDLYPLGQIMVDVGGGPDDPAGA